MPVRTGNDIDSNHVYRPRHHHRPLLRCASRRNISAGSVSLDIHRCAGRGYSGSSRSGSTLGGIDIRISTVSAEQQETITRDSVTSK
jgi:hypothetical protein